MKFWTTQWNYSEYKKEKAPNREPDNTKITVPGQAVSIKQLMDRYEKGRPVPQDDK